MLGRDFLFTSHYLDLKKFLHIMHLFLHWKLMMVISLYFITFSEKIYLKTSQLFFSK